MSRVERPLIGINGVLDVAREPRFALATRYADSVLKAGGLPVLLAPVGGPRDVEDVLDRVDGVLFSGGDDFDTARLGLGPVHPAATLVPSAKQDWDLLLARAVIARGIPVLGICYGMQLLGLAEGAGFFQHLPDDRPDAAPHAGGVEHAVRLATQSKLARIVREQELAVVSRHHQALARVAPPWRVSAVDPEGLIEAIERDEHPFAVGVQWHPELSSEGSPHDRIFRALIHAAAMQAAARVASSSR